MALQTTNDVKDEAATTPPWVWSQRWNDPLFLHWRTDPATLRPLIPTALEIDAHDGTAWVSLVLFRLLVRPRWLPYLPGLSALVEVNVRTYVRHRGEPGIWFITVHATNRIAGWLARLLTPIPYTYARMSYRLYGERFVFESGPPAPAALSFTPAGQASETAAGSLDEWLLERYRLFAPGRGGGLVEADVDHARWVVRSAEVMITANGYTGVAGMEPSRPPDLAHFADGVRARFGDYRTAAAVAGPREQG